MTVELFHLWECPSSARVREFIERRGLRARVRYVDIDDELGAEDRLFDLTGVSQTPCLVVDDDPLLGSAEIVAWIKRNLVAAPTPEAPGPDAAPVGP